MPNTSSPLPQPPTSTPSQPTPPTMPPLPPYPPLTLIVATTPSLGIGLQNTLPWPHLKADLRFFARVTKRLPPPPPPSLSHHTTTTSRVTNGAGEKKRRMNAVMMGRKTWESLPEKSRPLGGRVNVVLSRRMGREEGGEGVGGGKGEKDAGGGEVCLRAGGVEAGIGALRSMGTRGGQEEGEKGEGRDGEGEGGGIEIGRVFVIGGAEIYKAVLEGGWAERILWTRLEREWECDTWFPGGVLPGGGKEEEVVVEKEEGGKGLGRWVKRSTEEMERWVGESGVGGLRREGDVEFEVSMWEREREGEEGLGG